jgi:hypothetical protein
MTKRFTARAGTAIAAAMLICAASAARAEEGPFSGLSGSWSGNGTVTMANGSREHIRCRASYSVPPLGKQLNQGLNCASDSFKIEVRSNVFVGDGGALRGTWSEATHQVQGSVAGHVSAGQISTTVEASGFAAQLNVTTQGTRQSVSISPRGTDVQSVMIEMRRS